MQSCVDDYVGRLVVLRSQWTLDSKRIGLVVEQEKNPSDVVTVMWSTEGGIILKKHIQDAVIPITDKTFQKVEKRSCDTK